MCIMLLNYPTIKDHFASFDAKFYIVAITDGLGTTNESIVSTAINPLAARLPLDICIAAHFFYPEESRSFRSDQDLKGLSSPFLFISEENPFNGELVTKRAIIDLSALSNPDDVKRVLASIAELSYDIDFIMKAKSGEIVRKIQRALGKYSGPIKDCLSWAGFG